MNAAEPSSLPGHAEHTHTIRCPVCGEYVGPSSRCAHCGAAVKVRLSLRVFRWAAVGLATLGLALLFFAARYREIPRITVGGIERTMNFAYVRIAGVAADDARAFRKGERIEGLRFTLRDETGELVVRAYGEATKAVLEILPRAEKVPTHTVMLALPYSLLEQVRLLVGEWNGRILDEQFAADITMTMQFTVARFTGFQDALRELSHGSLTAEIIETHEDTIMPLGTFADDDVT